MIRYKNFFANFYKNILSNISIKLISLVINIIRLHYKIVTRISFHITQISYPRILSSVFTQS